MSSLFHSFAPFFVPSKVSLKTSSLPQHCSASSKIRGAINDDVPSASSANHTRAPLPNLRDMALSSSLADDQSGRRSDPSASATATAMAVMAPDTAKESTKGIGILNFLEGKSYFVTGATGLLAKAFVEKILRVAPNTRKIFLLVKAKDEEEALGRVKTEIIECGIFKRLKELHGEHYADFMMSKLVPVVGNMCEPDLGMPNVELATQIVEEVEVIVNSAASTTFDERYDVALNLNTRGPFRLLSFAMKCKKLRLFLHVSTAYVNGERQGVVREKPFYMGQSIAEEMANDPRANQSFALPKLDVHAEIKLASEIVQSLTKEDVVQKLKELGLVRAKMFGWQDTYVFTKAMGEMMLSSYKGHIPVTIIRPSIIESTYAEPFPGWIQGNRMVDPLLLSYGKGLLPGYLADPKALVDIVPVDMVVNTMVSAMAKHGIPSDPELSVYQVSSSVINPLKVHEMFGFSCDHFMSAPLKDSRGEEIAIERMKFFSSLNEFSAYIQDEVAERFGLRDSEVTSNPRRFEKLQMICKRTVESLIYKAKIYEPYAFYRGWFWSNWQSTKYSLHLKRNPIYLLNEPPLVAFACYMTNLGFLAQDEQSLGLANI
ncbi:hypothetical protein CRG98_023239 [Punica granatum]|uniref:Fatty acyl-CoA reductase n=1 Tax=Punica granatum TaxID=22663 RepID=A0A2I0JJB3_PUNGR|nr:hypothetical protein CRG98_023239 [Punica granatum]